MGLVKTINEPENHYSLLESRKSKYGISKKVTKNGLEVYNIILSYKKTYPRYHFPNIDHIRYYLREVYGIALQRMRISYILRDLVNHRFLRYDKMVYINKFKKVCGNYYIDIKKRNLMVKNNLVQIIDLKPYSPFLKPDTTIKIKPNEKKFRKTRRVSPYITKLTNDERKALHKQYKEERRRRSAEFLYNAELERGIEPRLYKRLL